MHYTFGPLERRWVLVPGIGESVDGLTDLPGVRGTQVPQVAELLEALLHKHPTETVYIAWGDASTHEDDEVDAVVRSAARCLVPALPPHIQPLAQSY